VRGGWGGTDLPSLRGAVIYGMQAKSNVYLDNLTLAYYIPSHPDNQYRVGDFYGYLGPEGGNGGYWHDWVTCPPGQGAIGMQGRSGAFVDAMGLICSDVTSPSPNNVTTLDVFGGSCEFGCGGSGYYDVCPQGALMVGVNVRGNVYIDHLQGICNWAH
jgi:hypothetical protein